MKIKYCVIIGISITLFGCKIKMPTSEHECLSDSKTIIQFVKRSEYERLANYIHKYEDYQNYTKADLEKEFNPLQKALTDINIGSLKSGVKKDTITVDYTTSKEYLININLYYFITDKQNHNIPVCQFRYTQKHNNNYYQLTFFDHDYRIKIKPVLPQ